MKHEYQVHLDNNAIINISSPYLDGGRKCESWQINEINVNDTKCTAHVSMQTHYASDTDTMGFHLSFITALEFVSQLHIVYMHVLAGLKVKTQEAWMVECRVHADQPVRNPERILVDTDIISMRKMGATYYCIAEHKVADDRGGSISIWLKVLLS